MDQKEKTFEQIVESTINLFNILKNMGIHDHTGAWLQFLHWDQKMDKQQEQARALMDKVKFAVFRENEQISSRLITSRVIYDLLGSAIYYDNDYSDFVSNTTREIKKLIDYKASRDINIPLVYLITKDLPVKFGLITIFNITEADKEDTWWENIINSGGEEESVRSYAQINTMGDLEVSISNSREIVSDMLIFLRAISFPITTKYVHQFGLLNEFPSLLVLPFKIGKPKENYQLEFHVQFSRLLGPGVFSYELERDFFSQIDQKNLEKLNIFIEDNYFNPSTELKRKLFLGLRWLGEATKPDVVESRFVKLFFSLEGLIGGGIGNSREAKIILAKRCAQLVGENQKEKDRIYKQILKFWNSSAKNSLVITRNS